MSQKVMQQALEALEWNYNTDLDNIPACEQWAKMLNETITALKQALAEPECKCTMRQKMVGDGCAVCNPERAKDLAEPQTTHWEGCEAVHPECRKPEQEPCAMRYDFDGYGYKYIDSGSGSNWHERIKGAEPLYTAPTPRKPLTDEEVVALFNRLCQERSAWPERRYRDFARWVERAHGITGESK